MVDLKTLKKALSHEARILLHGPEGVGKTTFACGAADAFMLDLEGGRALNEPLMPQEPKNYPEVLDFINSLVEQDHEYTTLIVDSLDILEEMVTEYTCQQKGYSNVTEPGYGKGYADRTANWKYFWDLLDALTEQKNMLIILVAHSHIVKVEDPVMPAFDKHALHLYKTEAAKACEIVDVIGFCALKSFTTKDGERNLAKTANQRKIYVRTNPAYTAKNRYSMTEEMPLEWPAFETELRTKMAKITE